MATVITTPDPSLNTADLAMWEHFRVPPELVAEQGILRLTDSGARRNYGYDQNDSLKDLSGLWFPYFIPQLEYRVTGRLRRDNPERTPNGRPENKYMTPRNDSHHLYFGSRERAKAFLDHPDTPVVLVESEKAWLTLTAWAERNGLDMFFVAMGGCYGWSDSKASSRIAADGDLVPVRGPSHDLIHCNGRRVYICLDNNKYTNPDVQQAEKRLVSAMSNPERNCDVLICDLPVVDGVNGPDDYVAICGDEAMKQVIADAHSPLAKVVEMPKPEAKPEPAAPPLSADQAAALTATLLEICREWILRFVVLGSPEATVLAFWILHSWAFDAAVTTPYIHVCSPEKESGKSTLLRVLKAVARDPKLSHSISSAALARIVGEVKPSLLLDELDALMKGDREKAQDIRGVLDSGFESDGVYTRCVGKDFKVTEFPTFSPKVLAGIGELWDTVESRAIHIELRRRIPDTEPVESSRVRHLKKEAAPIRKALEDWMNGGVVGLLEPIEAADVPGLGDRQMDISEPLLQIAEFAGPAWHQRLVDALRSIFKVSSTEDRSIGSLLLKDIQSIFKERGADRMFSRDLSAALCALEGQPWHNWAKGSGLTPHRLAHFLGRYHIVPGTIDIGEESLKGYKLEQFSDAFSRYTPVQNVETSEPASPLDETSFSKRRTQNEPTFRKVSEPHATVDVRRSDVSKGGGTGVTGKETQNGPAPEQGNAADTEVRV